MILKALYDYYNRCGKDIAPLNWAYVPFFYSIVLNIEGKFLRLEPLGGKEGLPLLTFRPEERTSAPLPHCMGDNGSYILGLKEVKDTDGFDFNSEFKKNHKNFMAFKNEVERVYKTLPNNKFAKAIHLFYQNYDNNPIAIDIIRQDNNWKDFCKALSKNITFSIGGNEGYAACDKEIINERIKSKINNNKETICLITGTKGRPVNTTYSSFIIAN